MNMAASTYLCLQANKLHIADVSVVIRAKSQFVWSKTPMINLENFMLAYFYTSILKGNPLRSKLKANTSKNLPYENHLKKHTSRLSAPYLATASSSESPTKPYSRGVKTVIGTVS